MNLRTFILALLIGPLPLLAEPLLPGEYIAELAAPNRVLWLMVPTNGHIQVIWGGIDPATGVIHANAWGEATDTNGKIIGTVRGAVRARGVLRAYARDGGRDGVTGTFRFRSHGGKYFTLRRFHARPW